MKLSPPELLQARHESSGFVSGEPPLDDWLKRHALKNHQNGATRTYVVCLEDSIIGYYSLAAGSIGHELAIGRVKRNMPDPIPVMVLARLAVHIDWQGKGLGPSLLQDAIHRTLQAADIIGIRAILVHAISDKAKRFYQYFGFQPSGIESMTLMVRMADLRARIQPHAV